MTWTRRDLLRGAAAGGLFALAGARRASPQDPVREIVERFLAETPAHDPGPRLAVVYFHWFAVVNGRQIGQMPGPALPADRYLQEPGELPRLRPGMLAWDGSVRHLRRHDLALVRAGFDTIICQLPVGYDRTKENHFASLGQLKAEGVAIPKVVPFVEAGSYRKYHFERNFHDPLKRQHLFDRYVAFFDLHFRYLGPEDLVWKDGRVFVHLWWIPGLDKAPASLLDELSERCAERYGFRLFVSGHEYLAHLEPDRLDRLFNGVQPWRRDRDGNYSLLPGFFPSSRDAVERGYFVERRFGATYREAWDAIEADLARSGETPEWIVVESANEIGECTSILPLVELSRRVFTEERARGLCTARPCIPWEARDYPIEIGEPRFYLDATRRAWGRLRERSGIA